MPLTFPISDNTLVLTVNQRLRRHLELREAQARQAAGETVWPTPAVFAITDWFQETWLQAWPDRWVLSPTQRQLLWEFIVGADPGYTRLDLLTLQGTAEQAAEAFALWHEFGLDPSYADLEITEETRAFARWKRAYEAFLQERGALDPVQLPKAVMQKMESGEISPPPRVVLAGFDELRPDLKNWIAWLQRRSVAVEFYPRHPEAPLPAVEELTEGRTLQRRTLEDARQEAIQCARWVRSVFQPGDRIGIVVLKMEEYRERLRRELMAELAPDSVYCWNRPELPFNLSLGGPLSEEPMIRAALNLLTAPPPPLPLTLFTEVIKSPYLNAAGSKEHLESLLELILNRKKMLQVDLQSAFKVIQLQKGVKKKESRQFKSLRGLIQKWHEYLTLPKRNKSLLPSQWAKTFSETLKQIGWPHTHRTLETRERQAYAEWENRLDEFAALDPVLGRLQRRVAAGHFERIVSNPARPFQELTREDSPIQVMGALEAAGHRFDHLWVMGCHAEVLPDIPRPNPFLPIRLQKAHHLPHASTARELAFARTLAARLMESSNHVVFSCPAWNGEEPLRPSPLLDFLPQVKEEIARSSRLKDQFPEGGLEWIDDAAPPATTDDELQQVQGGFRIFRNQAECPFRAFAAHRLQADRVEPPDMDYEYMDRGNLVHKVLELFWNQTRSLNALHQLAARHRVEEQVRQTVQTAMQMDPFKRTWENQPRFRQLEEDRLTELILEWLAREQERSEFTVLDQEKKERFSFQGLNLQLRVDRIDRGDEGRRLLIDYKTGQVKPGNWFSDPLRDPQLPLYACHLKPDAIAFAQVKKGKQRFQAAADPDWALPGIETLDLEKKSGHASWPELMRHWRGQLENLAQAFRQGQAVIRPIDEAACRHCNLGTLCRIEELKQRGDGDTPA